MIKKLQWDSDFFNLNVGDLTAKDYSNSMAFCDFDLIYVKSDEDCEINIDGFENSFSETKIIFSKSIFNKDYKSDNVCSISDVDYSIDNLYELAFESGKHSRFLLDKKFELAKFQSLYKKWIDNSIFNGFADDVLVSKKGEELLGLITYKILDDKASVGLFAVSKNAQGQGIGSEHLKSLEFILDEKGVKYLDIPTQESNSQACNFYRKLGYEEVDRLFIKHFWKK